MTLESLNRLLREFSDEKRRRKRKRKRERRRQGRKTHVHDDNEDDDDDDEAFCCGEAHRVVFYDPDKMLDRRKKEQF